ncbi:unnamed protein product [Tilletia caries]|nr:unnamed protein product [Tilletia caries]
MSSHQPKLFTRQELPILIPNYHRWMAKEHPDYVLKKDALFSREQMNSFEFDDDSQWRTVTYSKFAELINAATFLLGKDDFAGWPLRTAKDPIDTTPPKVAAFLGTDIASVATLEGLIQRGLSTLTLSPRNTPEVLIAMIVDQGIEHIVYAPAFAAVTATVAAKFAEQHSSRRLSTAELPSFEKLGAYGAETPFPYDLDTTAEYQKTVLYVHTSGSSGNMPTLCPYSHEMLLNIPQSYQLEHLVGQSHYGPLPLFHVMAHFFGIYYASAFLRTIVTQPPGPPLTGSELAAFIIKTKPGSCLLVPQQIDTLTEVPEGLKALASVDTVLFGGASLRRSTKVKLDEAKVNYMSGYGLSEVTACAMSFTKIRPSGLDGEWLKALDGGVNLEFDLYSEASGAVPALYTLIARNGALSCCVTNIEGGYDTGDLVERHPDYPEWFKIYGRKSSFVVLSNGENAPVPPIEDAVSSHESVGTALLFGKGQPQVGLLVELKPAYVVQPGDHAAAEAARDNLWPTIEKVNKNLPDFAKLYKNMIIFTTPDRPVPMADKGSPKRQVALNIYDDDIEALYASVTAGTDSAVNLGSIEEPALLDMVKSVLASVYGTETPIKPDTSLTLELGQDSLRATMTRTSIVSSLRAAAKSGTISQLAAFDPDTLPATLTYQYSTPAELATFLHEAITGNGKSSGDLTASRTAMMKELVEKYSQQIIASRRSTDHSTNKEGEPLKPGLLDRIFKHNSSKPRAHTVLLTGSSGAFGTTLLEQLVNHSGVEKVICLLRSENPDRSALLARQVQAYTSRNLDPAPAHSPKVEYLHGTPTDPNLVIPEVTSIIHAAWSVNFNLSLTDFTPEIEGVVRLLQHCQRTGARLVFASSVSTVMAAPQDAGKESTIPGIRLIAEDLEVPLEWTSIDYGVNWITSATTASRTNVVNLVNPQRMPWSQVVEAFRTHLPAHVKVVPSTEWLAHVEEASRKLSTSKDPKADLARIPAVNLVTTYQGLVASRHQVLLEVKAAKDLTKGEIDSAVVVDEDLAGRYVRFWQEQASSS